MSPQSGVPYEKRQPSPELRAFLDPLKPGAYFDCGRARLYGIDEVLEQEAERRGRPVGPDHFQLVATDGGLIFCRASITFAIAARWKDVTMSRPVDRSDEERVDLAVVWPNHGELTFTLSRRLASNVFRRWLQFQAQNTRRHQVEQAARYERSQRSRPEPETEGGPFSEAQDQDEGKGKRRGEGGSVGRTLASSPTPTPTPTPAPATLQLDEAEREVLRMAVQSGEVGSLATPADPYPEVRAGPSGAEADMARVVPAGDMAATTHFEDQAGNAAPVPDGQAVPDQSGPPDPASQTSANTDTAGSGDDWRNGWTYSDDQESDEGDTRRSDYQPGNEPAAPSLARRPYEDVDRMRRAAADTQVFHDAMPADSEPGRAGTVSRKRGRLAVGHLSRSSGDTSTSVRLGDLTISYDADPDPGRHRATDRAGVNHSRGGYLDGLPANAGDAALASSGAPDRRTRPESELNSSNRSVSERRDVEPAQPVQVPQITGARLQTSESSRRRRNPDGLDIRSVVLTDPEHSLWSDIWHRHRISIMATVSLVALLVIAVSSLLARNSDDAASGTTVDADIAIPIRQDPIETDSTADVDGDAARDSTAPAGPEVDGSEVEPNSPMIVDAVGGSETGGGETDMEGRPGSSGTGTDQSTATTTVRICHSNYGGCVPVAPDVDCEGDGDGPAFLSEPVVIFGEDVYDLDTDGDREACEPDQPPADQADT